MSHFACTVAILLALALGCNPAGKVEPATPAEPPSLSVAVVKPQRATLALTVRQPGSIQAFEQTLVFAKVPAYVAEWKADLGDHVHKGDVLATLRAPEMGVEVRQKKALVQQAEAEVRQAQDSAVAAEAALRSAEARIKEAEASRGRAQAEQRRMKSQYTRLSKVGQSGLLDKENVEEIKYGLEAAEAGLEEVEARIKSAEAARDESSAKLAKARGDIGAARAHLAVANANRRYTQVMLDYLTLRAPFDGVVTRRNINAGDFVQPATTGKGEPLYVVERRDQVRVFVEVPESAAGWVHKGATARIRVPALTGQEFVRPVERTSYALDRIARTLVAEIDLPNPDDRLRPNMYAHATISADYPGVWTLPLSAVVTQGDVMQGYQTFCFLVEDGKVRRTPIEVGVRDDQRVEVLKKEARPAQPGGKGVWEGFTGNELVVRDNLAGLKDGQAVGIAPGKE